MDARKEKKLNQIENVLFIIISAAIVTDILSLDSHSIVLVLSTIILLAGIIGIIAIEIFKLQRKQK